MLIQVLQNLEGEYGPVRARDLHGVENVRQVEIVEQYVHHRPVDAGDDAFSLVEQGFVLLSRIHSGLPRRFPPDVSMTLDVTSLWRRRLMSAESSAAEVSALS